MTAPLNLAFYKGRGTAVDRLIRAATRSSFSHVELVIGNEPQGMFDFFDLPAISSSFRDGGVRRKTITFDRDNWEFVHVQGWARPDAWVRATSQIGARYDYAGILMNFTVPLRRHLRDSWFCSELCGHALGIHNPHTHSPGDLRFRVRELNAAFRKGRVAAGIE